MTPRSSETQGLDSLHCVWHTEPPGSVTPSIQYDAAAPPYCVDMDAPAGVRSATLRGRLGGGGVGGGTLG